VSRNQQGAASEAVAAELLQRKGFRVLERNYRSRVGELDLVCRDGEALVFVEVRSRRDARFGGGLLAVGLRKQRQVVRAARAYLARNPQPEGTVCRFDVVGVTGEIVEHVVDAFRVAD
jgi:putative endonuclease